MLAPLHLVCIRLTQKKGDIIKQTCPDLIEYLYSASNFGSIV